MHDRRSFIKGTIMASAAMTAGAERGEAAVQDRPKIEIVGDWQVRVGAGEWRVGRATVRVAHPVTLDVYQPDYVIAEDEKYESLPMFDPKAAPWSRGAKLKQLVTFETTAPDMLVPESLVLKSGPGAAERYVAGKDYAVEPRWATIGRLPGGIGPDRPVWADYECGWHRIDSITVNRQGVVSIRAGEAHNATPHPRKFPTGTTVLANLWIPGLIAKLSPENLYPVLEPVYPVRARKGPPPAAKLLPKTWAKLHAGKPLHILAWGDSVTAGGQASDAAHQYQSRFVAHLHALFPHASLRLTTAAWGGRNSDSFLNEPPGAKYNFESAVLEPKPDLIVMEFVNDAGMTPDVVERKYEFLRKCFVEIGAEWVILTPHFVRPDWMGASSVRVEADPRPYVAGVRAFAAKHGVALADASLRWGHLAKEGVPYITLLSNSINHPDDRGHEMFAQSLISLFR